jgi:enamine deaminase RidA (YjgF/YER057c/UK114 family)
MSAGERVEFERVSSHAMWENIVGYCRAVKAGSLVFVTGTAPIDESGSGVHAPGDAEAQARRCLELIERALAGFGLDRTRIARTRMFVTDISRWRDYGRAHAAFFGAERPATSMIEVKSLIDPAMMIEIEADAVA